MLKAYVFYTDEVVFQSYGRLCNYRRCLAQVKDFNKRFRRFSVQLMSLSVRIIMVVCNSGYTDLHFYVKSSDYLDFRSDSVHFRSDDHQKCSGSWQKRSDSSEKSSDYQLPKQINMSFPSSIRGKYG
jgi:hypothetical protein